MLEIADRNGTILARLPDNDAWRGRPLPEPVRALATAPEPGSVDVVRDGVSYVLGYVPLAVPPTELHVGVAVERNAAFADLHRASERRHHPDRARLERVAAHRPVLGAVRRAPAGAGPLGLAGRWRTGNYVPRDRPWSGSELGRLGQAFDDLARTVNERERELREREKYLSIVLDRVPVGIMQTDKDGRYVYFNKKFREISGRTTEELIGRDFRDHTHPDDVTSNTGLFERTVETGEPYVLRKRYVRPDNSVIWVEVTVARLDEAAKAC